MNIKISLFIIILSVQSFLAQETDFIKDIVSDIELNFNFITNEDLPYKEGGFDFTNFSETLEFNNEDFFKLYYDNNQLIKLSRHCVQGGYSNNFLLLINKKTSGYIIYTMSYFPNSQHEYSEAITCSGFYLYDIYNRVNYFIGTSSHYQDLILMENEEIKFETIEIKKGFRTDYVSNVYYLNSNLEAKKSIGWYKNGLEMCKSFNLSKLDNERYKINIDFYSKYRCQKEILLNDLKLKGLYEIFNVGVHCDIFYTVEEKLETPFNKPIMYFFE